MYDGLMGTVCMRLYTILLAQYTKRKSNIVAVNMLEASEEKPPEVDVELANLEHKTKELITKLGLSAGNGVYYYEKGGLS